MLSCKTVSHPCERNRNKRYLWLTDNIDCWSSGDFNVVDFNEAAIGLILCGPRNLQLRQEVTLEHVKLAVRYFMVDHVPWELFNYVGSEIVRGINGKHNQAN